MASPQRRQEVVELIRAEISKYAERPFGNDDHLVRDAHVLGDDLTAAALSIERRLGVSVNRSRYRLVCSVNELADAMEDALQRNA